MSERKTVSGMGLRGADVRFALIHIGMDAPLFGCPSMCTEGTVDLTPKAGPPIPQMAFQVMSRAAWLLVWYRIRVRVTARSGENLALAGPVNVDDAYQVVYNGTLLGSFDQEDDILVLRVKREGRRVEAMTAETAAAVR